MALRINDSEVYAIDSHSHLGRRKTPLGHGVASFLGEDLVRNLDEVGLDCAVAFPLGASYTDYSEANQIMADEMAKYPKRIISFCRINPNFGPEATAKSLEHCLGTLKLKGIKLHPEIEFFDPNEAELMEPIYDAARRYHVPIIFHTGMSSKASPGVIAELAAQHKDVPVILGHMGACRSMSSWPWPSPGRTKIYSWKPPWSVGCRFFSKRFEASARARFYSAPITPIILYPWKWRRSPNM